MIIGAGPAGIGCALALRRAGVERVLVLEAESVGASFARWPQEMRLITPSFHANPFFQTDLNAITPDTSPADLFQQEHLSGEEYADYLQAVVDHFGIDVAEKEKVRRIQPGEDGFVVETDRSTHRASTVIWAGGEFSHPKRADFPGAEFCPHSSEFRSWRNFPGEEAVVIGGYESGIDAACHLARLGKKVMVLSTGQPWNVDSPDPSETLSPVTRKRLLDTLAAHPDRLGLLPHMTVTAVNRDTDAYSLQTAGGRTFELADPPILATGFHSALTPVKELFAWEDGVARFTEDDESTLHPGLFYSGPSLVQRGSKFCFIYKFRARFGVVARAIARRLGHPEPDLEDDRRRGFLVDDLECCTNCECAVESKADAVGPNQ